MFRNRDAYLASLDYPNLIVYSMVDDAFKPYMGFVKSGFKIFDDAIEDELKLAKINYHPHDELSSVIPSLISMPREADKSLHKAVFALIYPSQYVSHSGDIFFQYCVCSTISPGMVRLSSTIRLTSKNSINTKNAAYMAAEVETLVKNGILSQFAYHY
jgi:hypothetical protein